MTKMSIILKLIQNNVAICLHKMKQAMVAAEIFCRGFIKKLKYINITQKKPSRISAKGRTSMGQKSEIFLIK